jgi:hypothetical protein
MPDISNTLIFTTREWAYICAHVGWQPPDLARFVATCIGESQLHSGAYRTALDNPVIPLTVPKNRAGHDWSIAMMNDFFFPKDDPFTRFDPITAARDALGIFKQNGLAPWGWFSKRNDVNMHVADVNAEIGPEPYAITASPYWRMRKASINTWDMPVPPADLYVSALPPAPLKYGQGNFPPNPQGVAINQLQRVAQSMNRWPGTLDYYYGGRVAAFVQSIQTDLWKSGLWAGALDGKVYSVELRAVWDGVLSASFAFNRGAI